MQFDPRFLKSGGDHFLSGVVRVQLARHRWVDNGQGPAAAYRDWVIKAFNAGRTVPIGLDRTQNSTVELFPTLASIVDGDLIWFPVDEAFAGVNFFASREAKLQAVFEGRFDVLSPFDKRVVVASFLVAVSPFLSSKFRMYDTCRSGGIVTFNRTTPDADTGEQLSRGATEFYVRRVMKPYVLPALDGVRGLDHDLSMGSVLNEFVAHFGCDSAEFLPMEENMVSFASGG